MFRFLTLAMLMVGALVVTAGPLTRTCSKTTGSGGEVTETCLEVGRIENRDINRTETTTSGLGSININKPELGVEAINTNSVRGNFMRGSNYLDWDFGNETLDDSFDDFLAYD